jgi:hypothetical protein
MATAAQQVANECTGSSLREVQYIRGLCELMREQACAGDCLKLEALAASIAKTANCVAERLK